MEVASRGSRALAAVEAGLALGDNGVRVDTRMRTSDPDIYAVGDAAEKTSALTGDDQMVWLANLANRHGRLVDLQSIGHRRQPQQRTRIEVEIQPLERELVALALGIGGDTVQPRLREMKSNLRSKRYT